VTTLTISTYAGTLEERRETLRTMVDALDAAGVGD
jgi:hypothetical protein